MTLIWLLVPAAFVVGAAAALALHRARAAGPSRMGTEDAVAVIAPLVDASGEHDLRLMTHEIRAASVGQMQLLEQMTHALEQLSGRADSVRASADDSRDIASATSGRAVEGSVIVRRLAVDLDDAVTVAQDAMGTLGDLAGRVGEVGALAALIDRVASRTRLVALNATIEARRTAGAGSAFDVIAQEVQALADQASEAAAAIGSITRSVTAAAAQSAVSEAAMIDASSRIRAGSGNARAAGEAFDGIVADIETLSDLVAGVATACTRQAAHSQAAVRDAQGITAAARSTVASAGGLARAAELLEQALDDTSARSVEQVGDPAVSRAHRLVVTTLRPLFDVPRQHAASFVALSRARQASVGRLCTQDLEALNSLMQSNLSRFPDIHGATVTIVPGALADTEFFMQWWIADNGVPRRLLVQLEPSSPTFYDYRTADWYRVPLETRRTWLSDPYFDQGGADADIVTISVPALDGDLELGVATEDIGLDQIHRLCEEALAALARPAALVTASGVLVTGTEGAVGTPGQPLPEAMREWVAAAPVGWSNAGPDGVALARVPGFAWSMMVWPASR